MVTRSVYGRIREKFGRSRRGNLWCKYMGETLSVFDRRTGGYGWSRADGKEVTFSGAFEREGEALTDLADSVLGLSSRW